MNKTTIIQMDEAELQELLQQAAAWGAQMALAQFREQTITPTQLLTRFELAHVLRTTPQHVSQLVKRGLPAWGKGKDRRFRLGEVMAWMQGQEPPHVIH